MRVQPLWGYRVVSVRIVSGHEEDETARVYSLNTANGNFEGLLPQDLNEPFTAKMPNQDVIVEFNYQQYNERRPAEEQVQLVGAEGTYIDVQDLDNVVGGDGEVDQDDDQMAKVKLVDSLRIDEYSFKEILISSGGTLEDSDEYGKWIPKEPVVTDAVYIYKGLSKSFSSYVAYDITSTLTDDITLYAWYVVDPEWKKSDSHLKALVLETKKLSISGDNIPQGHKNYIDQEIGEVFNKLNRVPVCTTEELDLVYSRLYDCWYTILPLIRGLGRLNGRDPNDHHLILMLCFFSNWSGNRILSLRG